MLNHKKIAVVIPCYRVAGFVEGVVRSIPDFVDHIIVVDDCCPENSGMMLEKLNITNVIVLFHEHNLGVGGAVKNGYKKALELNADIVVKVDGDGQMDPDYMQTLIAPLLHDKADYTKGNRFKDFNALKEMPNIRLFGNSVLSFLVKVSSGYWKIMDPTNGYTAIGKKALQGIELDSIADRYFFETDMLIHLNIENCVVKDIPIPAKYGDEKSSLNITKVLFQFPPKLLKRFFKRIFYRYFIYDFNMGTIYLIFGFPMFLFGLLFGSYRWYLSIAENVENSTGTVMLSVLPIILGVQFLLQAISIDMDLTPKHKEPE